MNILFLLPLLLTSPLTIQNPYSLSKGSHNNDVFVLENISGNEYRITGVKDEYKTASELRVYSSEDYKVIDIDEHAFDECSKIDELMISNTVKKLTVSTINNLSNLKVFNFTGSFEELNKIGKFEGNYLLKEYACDEGFLNFWKEKIRPTETSSLCDVEREDFDKVDALYESLDIADKATVDSVSDGDSTIKDAMKYLKDFFDQTKKEVQTKEVSKSTMITFILIIASVGMTFICIFYLLRERKIIN